MVIVHEDKYAVLLQDGEWMVRCAPSLESEIVGRLRNGATVFGELKTIARSQWVEASRFDGDYDIYDHLPPFWVYYQNEQTARLQREEPEKENTSWWNRVSLCNVRPSLVESKPQEIQNIQLNMERPSWTARMQMMMDWSGGDIDGDAETLFQEKQAKVVKQHIINLRDALRDFSNEQCLAQGKCLDKNTLKPLREALEKTATVTKTETAIKDSRETLYYVDKCDTLLVNVPVSRLSTESIPRHYFQSMYEVALEITRCRDSLRKERFEKDLKMQKL